MRSMTVDRTEIKAAADGAVDLARDLSNTAAGLAPLTHESCRLLAQRADRVRAMLHDILAKERELDAALDDMLTSTNRFSFDE